eukprot:6536305-Pyramimonas_sp.AAC.2
MSQTRGFRSARHRGWARERGEGLPCVRREEADLRVPGAFVARLERVRVDGAAQVVPEERDAICLVEVQRAVVPASRNVGLKRSIRASLDTAFGSLGLSLRVWEADSRPYCVHPQSRTSTSGLPDPNPNPEVS